MIEGNRLTQEQVVEVISAKGHFVGRERMKTKFVGITRHSNMWKALLRIRQR